MILVELGLASDMEASLHQVSLVRNIWCGWATDKTARRAEGTLTEALLWAKQMVESPARPDFPGLPSEGQGKSTAASQDVVQGESSAASQDVAQGQSSAASQDAHRTLRSKSSSAAATSADSQAKEDQGEGGEGAEGKGRKSKRPAQAPPPKPAGAATAVKAKAAVKAKVKAMPKATPKPPPKAMPKTPPEPKASLAQPVEPQEPLQTARQPPAPPPARRAKTEPKASQAEAEAETETPAVSQSVQSEAAAAAAAPPAVSQSVKREAESSAGPAAVSQRTGLAQPKASKEDEALREQLRRQLAEVENRLGADEFLRRHGLQTAADTNGEGHTALHLLMEEVRRGEASEGLALSVLNAVPTGLLDAVTTGGRPSGATALHMVCGQGRDSSQLRCRLVRELAERRAELELRDSRGATALLRAVGCQSPDVVAVLLEARANGLATHRATGRNAYDLAHTEARQLKPKA
jgi:hypothetical protein